MSVRLAKGTRCLQPLCIFQSYNNEKGKAKYYCDNPLAEGKGLKNKKGYLQLCPYIWLLKVMVEHGTELTAVQKMMLEQVGVKLDED